MQDLTVRHECERDRENRALCIDWTLLMGRLSYVAWHDVGFPNGTYTKSFNPVFVTHAKEHEAGAY